MVYFFLSQRYLHSAAIEVAAATIHGLILRMMAFSAEQSVGILVFEIQKNTHNVIARFAMIAQHA